MARPAALVLLVLLSHGEGTAAQAAPRYEAARLNGMTFAEQVRSDISTQSGTADRRRLVLRSAQFTVAARADTVIVTADTVSLVQEADGVREAVDVDAVIGGRWKVMIAAHGAASVVEAPVVPQSVADISDLGRAMDDFFPAVPPVLRVGGQVTDAAGMKWRRNSDSSGVARYHFSGVHATVPGADADTVSVEAKGNVTEVTDLAWDASRGPVAWSRTLTIVETSRFAGQTVRAQVQQQINVRQVPSH